ncbi:hypothetical protein GQ54DRAFT_71161 [Martensiomyces pterosporus]|nr:hypothetical protein GQ54DRAFT_71161 [Martensiomyces pterosporus]
MSDADDFNYDSVVSDPAIYSGILGSESGSREKVNVNQNDVLTPESNRVETPQPAGPPGTDSNPSLAVSTPSSDKFQLEYEREGREQGHFGSSQSQYGLKSGIYMNGSTTDFENKLKGSVVVSGQWTAVGDQKGAPRMKSPASESQQSTPGDGYAKQKSIAGESTLDVPSFNDSTDVTLSRLIRESSQDDRDKKDMLQRQFNRSASLSPESPSARYATEGSVEEAPGATHAHRNQDGSATGPTESLALRSALRRNRPAPLAASRGTDDLPSTTPRKVSFVGVPPASSAESSLLGSDAHRSASAAARGNPTTGSGSEESIMMLSPQEGSLSLTNPPWEDSQPGARSSLPPPTSNQSGANSLHMGKSSHSTPTQLQRGIGAPHDASIGSMDTQPLTDSMQLPLHRRHGSLDAPPPQLVHMPLSPPAVSSGRPSLDGVAGVGVGMSGDVFRKFAAWSRGNLSPRTSPTTAPNVVLPDDPLPKLIEDRTEDRDPARSSGKSPDKANSTVTSHDSSISTSSTSPMKTEPMRSQILSNFSTPRSSKHGSQNASTGLSAHRGVGGFTPPARSTPSSKRSSQTPNRSVNPLARHLAMKAIKSAPQEQRSVLSQSHMSTDSTPTHARSHDGTRSLFDLGGSVSAFSSGIGAGDATGSDMLNLSDIQRQFDGFASQLKHDASAVQEELRESEEAWFGMQQELQKLRTQLLDAEATRDFYQRQAEASEKDRDEWERDRQQMQDEKDDLIQSIQEWRKRIGDVENERQGVWTEGYQTREQLLHTIARLEDELGDSRSDASRMHAKMDALAAEFEQKEAAWSDVNGELSDHANNLELEYNQLDSENRQLQADLADVNEKRMQAESEAQEQAGLAKAVQGKVADLERRLLGAEAEKADAGAKAEEAEERAGVLEEKLEGLAQASGTAESRKAELSAELASLREANRLLSETLENLTEENRELKQSRDESNFFTTALSASALPRDSPSKTGQPKPEVLESEAVSKLKVQHRDELQRLTSDYEEIVESMKTLMESKNRYKKENSELADMAETARSEIESLRKQLSESQAAAQEEAGGRCGHDEELEQLREAEGRLARELDSAEHDNEELGGRIRSLEGRNKQLASKNDELSQRTARLETELSDLQLQMSSSSHQDDAKHARSSEEVAELHKKVSHFQQIAAELEKDVSCINKDNDQLRQTMASKDVQIDDLQMSLVRTKEQLSFEKEALTEAQGLVAELRSAEDKLKSEVADLSGRIARTTTGQAAQQSSGDSAPPGASMLETSNFDQPEQLVQREFELSQSVRHIKSDVSVLEHSIRQMTERHEKLQKEQRFLADQLRDTLLRNATLRSELTAILLRRAGKIRELKTLQSASSAANEYSAPSDDGNSSIMSGTINNVPSASQIIDGSSTKFFKSLDQHLDEMADIIDSGDAQSQRSAPAKTASLRRSNSQPSGSRMASKMLTPIREESSMHQHVQRDASVQCDLASDEISSAYKQLEEDLDMARSQAYHLEEECRAVRSNIAEVKQERDQFKVSQEEAAERVSYLTGQIEELSESHERMKAVNITTARISLRVSRQLRVLKMALGRLVPRDALQTGQPEGDNQVSSLDAEDKEEALALEEDDAMIKATMDHPLGIDDYAAFDAALQPGAGRECEPGSNEVNGEDGRAVSNDDVLEQVGVSVSEAYGEVKRIRRDIIRAKKERSRLMKRLAEVERSKLPSYELSTQSHRQQRSRALPCS